MIWALALLDARAEEVVVVAPAEVPDDPAAASDLSQAVDHLLGVMGYPNARGEDAIWVHGLEQHQILLTVDGAPAAGAYDGVLPTQGIPSFFVRSVALEGASLGEGGLGPALRVETLQPPKTKDYSAMISGSPHGAGRAGVFVGGPLRGGSLGAGLHLSRDPGSPLSSAFIPTSREDGGRRDGDRADHAHLLLTGERGPWRLRGLSSLGAWDVPTSLTDSAPRYWRFTSVASHSAQLSWKFHGVQGRLWGRYDDNTLDSYDDATRATQTGADGWTSRYRDSHVGIDGGVQRYLFGMDWEKMLRLERLTHRADTHEAAATRAALALRAARPFLTRWSGEVAMNAAVEAGNAAILDPAVALSWTRGATRLRLAGGRNSRFPTLKERFSPALGVRIPNPALRPERATGLDAALSARLGPVTAAATAWTNRTYDLIDNTELSGGLEQLQNVGEVDLAGAELRAQLRASRFLEIGLGVAGLHTYQRTGAAAGYPLEGRPTWEARALATARPLEALRLELRADALGPAAWHNSDLMEWELSSPQLVFGGSVAWAYRALALRLSADNLLDRDLSRAPGFPTPGRVVYLEFRRFSERSAR